MKHYNEHELDEKIHAFLSKKLEKYPELARKSTVTHPTAMLRVPYVTRSLIWSLGH